MCSVLQFKSDVLSQTTHLLKFCERVHNDFQLSGLWLKCRWVNHFDPYSEIFSKRERVEVSTTQGCPRGIPHSATNACQ